MSNEVLQVLAGKLAPLGERQAPSGIAKHPVQGRVRVGLEGIDGDEQGDRSVHGGPEKAVHHYAFDHYSVWRAEIDCEDLLRHPGAFGENIASLGLTEAEVAIGDVFCAGSVVLQVSQGRQPCWKLNSRFLVPDMVKRVLRTGRTGWYYRVLQPGVIEAGDEIILKDRPSPQWTLQRAWRALFLDAGRADDLIELVQLPHLAENVKGLARRRLAAGGSSAEPTGPSVAMPGTFSGERR